MMLILRMNMLMLAIAITALNSGCDREDSVKKSLKGQANSSLTFYGLVVDQDGQPLEGAHFEIEVEAIPADWTFDKRGKPHALSTVTATTGNDGRFQVAIVGHILRFKKVERTGYRHFYDLNTGDSRAIDNTAYQLNAWSDLWYKSDPDDPAVYVFVKDDVNEVSALPCRGGYNSVNGKQWTPNKPAWPKKPSLPDVVYKAPSTNPATQP